MNKNINFLFSIFFLIACSTDVGIITVNKQQNDSATLIDTSKEETGIEESTVEETSNEPGSETSELSGTVGLVKWELEQVACPACMGVPQEITVTFESDFHDNMNDTHPTWVPPQGQWIQTLNYISINRNSLDLGSSINIIGSYNTFTALKNNSNLYLANIYESQYDRDTNYTVQMQDGTTFNFKSIRGFDFIEPLELRYVDPSYAFATPIRKTGSTFWWGPSGTSEDFNITLAVYSQDGSQMLGYVSCTGADNGMMTIPGNYLTSFPNWSLVAVHMTRFDQQRVPYENLNGYVDIQLYWSVVGTGHIE